MASVISEAQFELIRTLSSDDIPIKLRCAICSKLAVNAFRLPCCEQAICEKCQSSLPQSCPVCEHSPLAAEDCNPNKSLRTTIRVFLRTAEKKREANRPKEAKSSTPGNTAEATHPSLPAANSNAKELAAAPTPNETEPVDESQASKPQDDTACNTALGSKALSSVPGDGPQQKDPEAPTPPQAAGNDQPGCSADEAAAEGGGEKMNCTEQGMVETVAAPDEDSNDQTGYRMDSDYSNMMYPLSNDFTQIQMMMAMQNGMGGQAFSGFPMMSMNMNMSMDPVTMQNMYMNGGFQGMGMNGMNGMTGMGGYGGGSGHGSNHNWNGSQSWNFDQDNYNQSGLGIGAGDFGNLTAGFQTGYNQVNYGHFADYRRNNFGRGRIRGRGYFGAFGRGGHHLNGGMGHSQDQGQHSQYEQAISPPVLAETETRQNPADSKQAAQDGHAGRPGGEKSQGAEQRPGEGCGSEEVAGKGRGQLASRENLGNETGGDVARKVPPASEAGAIRSVLSTPDVPINAPTGPKAMRQGLPNTSLHHLRARGYQVDAGPASPATAAGPQQQQTPGADRGAGPKSRSPEREREKTAGAADAAQPTSHEGHEASGRDSQGPSRDGTNRSRSRSRSRGQLCSHRPQRRHRSPSAADAEDGGGKKAVDSGRGRKKSRSRRKHGGGDRYPALRDERRPERSWSASPDGPRKAGPRGSRDGGREHDGRREHRDRHRRDDERDKPSRRSRRERERDRHRERERGRERERDRDQARWRDRDGTAAELDRKDKDRARDKDADRDARPDVSSRRTSLAAGRSASAERDARNRERLVKEAQRMAGLAGSKRARDATDATAGRKGRRVGGRRDAHLRAAADEERMRRLEAERDAGRWHYPTND